MCWRLKRLGYSIGVEPSSQVYHVGGGTLSADNPQKTYLNFRNSLYMMHKNLPFIQAVFLIFAMVSGNRLGGADVKVSAACAFLLGFSKSIAGLVIGLFLAIICNIYFSHKNKTKGKAFPLVPYLSIGFMTAFFV